MKDSFLLKHWRLPSPSQHHYMTAEERILFFTQFFPLKTEFSILDKFWIRRKLVYSSPMCFRFGQVLLHLENTTCYVK